MSLKPFSGQTYFRIEESADPTQFLEIPVYQMELPQYQNNIANYPVVGGRIQSDNVRRVPTQLNIIGGFIYCYRIGCVIWSCTGFFK